jgi:hypothetical protein
MPPKAWVAAAVAVLVILVFAAVGAVLRDDDPAAPAAVQTSEPDIDGMGTPAVAPSAARLDLEATCILAVPAATATADLVAEWIATPDDKIRGLDAAKYADNFTALRNIAAVGDPQIEPHLSLLAGVMQRLRSTIVSGGSYTLRTSEVGAAGAAVATACAPFARKSS